MDLVALIQDTDRTKINQETNNWILEVRKLTTLDWIEVNGIKLVINDIKMSGKGPKFTLEYWWDSWNEWFDGKKKAIVPKINQQRIYNDIVI